MKVVRVISVVKDPMSNAETVMAEGSGAGWGAVKAITFVAPAGTHRVDQRVEIQNIQGTTGY